MVRLAYESLWLIANLTTVDLTNYFVHIRCRFAGESDELKQLVGILSCGRIPHLWNYQISRPPGSFALHFRIVTSREGTGVRQVGEIHQKARVPRQGSPRARDIPPNLEDCL